MLRIIIGFFIGIASTIIFIFIMIGIKEYKEISDEEWINKQIEKQRKNKNKD